MISRKLPLHLAAGTLALGIAIAAPAATWAQPTAGHVFRFSSCFSCSQHNPTVAGNAAGDFLGTWTEPRDVISEGVFSRTFNAALTPFGNDFEVAPGAIGDPPQFDGAAVADSQGNFVVVWSSLADGQSVILAQRFDPKGNPLGNQIEVAADPGSPVTPSDFKPAVAAAPGGGFVAAWVSLAPAGGPPGPPRVLVRRFDATGAATSAAVQLSTSAVLGDRPSLCVSATGRVHAAWTFTDELLPFQPSPVGVVVRRLSPAGVLIGNEQVISPAVDSESSVAIACGRGNTYVVAWQTAQAPAVSGSDIVVRRFTRLGRAVGAPFVLNQQVDQDQMNPALAVDSSGALVAVWEGNPGGVHNVRGRRFAANGTPLSDEFAVYNAGQGTFSALRPAVAILGAGSFVVAVDSPGGILGRIFSVSGAHSAAEAAEAAEAAGAGAAEEAAGVNGGGTTGNGRGAGGLWQHRRQ